MSNDFFAHKAGNYESDKNRVDNVANIANTLLQTVTLDPAMHIMDFGSGTGLLLEKVAPYVGKITAVDISESMNQQLDNKRSSLPCELDILALDLDQDGLAETFDGIISSMTLHHIKDVDAMFRKLLTNLNSGGFIAIADLDTEDGSFHTEDTGVHHFGFDRKDLESRVRDAGFVDVETHNASIVVKPHGHYDVFLLTAKSPV